MLGVAQYWLLTGQRLSKKSLLLAVDHDMHSRIAWAAMLVV